MGKEVVIEMGMVVEVVVEMVLEVSRLCRP